MALSSTARDILDMLPSDSFIETDTSTDIAVEVPSRSIITDDAIDAICAIFRGARSEPVRASIDFKNHTIHLKTGGCSFVEPAHRESGLVASTESENLAVRIADRIGTIDYDDLVPHCTLHTNDTHTVLHLADLLHVSHDAVRYYTKEEQDLSVQYDMPQHAVCVLVPRRNKRKR